MKARFLLSLLAATATALPSAQTPNNTEREPSACGSLADFRPEELPANVDPAQVRACVDHPLGPAEDLRKREAVAAAEAAGASAEDIFGLSKRECRRGRQFGCTNGYCWKSCDRNGRWCWTAINAGFGEWHTCRFDRECSTRMDCGRGNCRRCGCHC